MVSEPSSTRTRSPSRRGKGAPTGASPRPPAPTEQVVTPAPEAARAPTSRSELHPAETGAPVPDVASRTPVEVAPVSAEAEERPPVATRSASPEAPSEPPSAAASISADVAGSVVDQVSEAQPSVAARSGEVAALDEPDPQAAVGAWRAELIDGLREEVEAGLAAGRALAGCRSPQAAWGVQSDYLARAMRRGGDRAQRLMRLWVAMAQHGAGPADRP